MTNKKERCKWVLVKEGYDWDMNDKETVKIECMEYERVYTNLGVDEFSYCPYCGKSIEHVNKKGTN